MKKNAIWGRIVLLNFLVAACLGALMRLAFVTEISGMNFRNVLHGHTHVAILGWVYLALFILIIQNFLPEPKAQKTIYRRLFWTTQIAVMGMALTFPFTGYAPLSIFFSTLHVLLSYGFVYHLLKDLPQGQGAFSHTLLKAGLFFMVLSTIGLWAMGPIMAFDLRGSILYHLAVQFYLHFQFNGWFVFTALALFWSWSEQKHIFSSSSRASSPKPFFLSLLISCILTYFLAITWAQPLPFLFAVNGLGVLIQLLALVLFFKILLPFAKSVRQSFSPTLSWLWWVALLCFALKIIIQSLVVFPEIASISYTIRNYVIGFLHLLLLGMVSHFLLAFGSESRVFHNQTRLARWGTMIFFIGFLSSELLLFVQGSMFWGAQGFLPAYYESLFGVSALIPVGIFIFLLPQLRPIGKS